MLTLNEAAQLYVGEDRMDVRKKIVRVLEEEGFLQKVEDYTNQVGFSERTDAVVEPRLSLQWWVSMKPLSGYALTSVADEEIKFYPPKFKNTYRHWMENIKDWCISRQLWWGHRIPAYYAPDGYIQVRSLGHSKKLCREMICLREWNGDKKVTYKDYENAGYYIRKVVVDIVVILKK